MQAERSRTDWFTWHIRQTPFQLMHMRTLAEHTVSATAVGAGKITGSKDVARLPYRIDPADDADQLWAELVLFGREVAERIGGASPRPLRAGNWVGRDEPQGLPVCTPSEAFSRAAEIVQWLEASAQTIAHDGGLGDAPDHLCGLIRKMRARYPRAEPKFRSYKPRLCPCQTAIGSTTRTIYVTAATGDLIARCEACGNTWTR